MGAYSAWQLNAAVGGDQGNNDPKHRGAQIEASGWGGGNSQKDRGRAGHNDENEDAEIAPRSGAFHSAETR